MKNINSSGHQNGTNTQARSTKTISESATQGTLLKSQLQTSQTLTFWWADFLANHLASLENVKDFKTPEALSFLISLGFLPTKDPDIFCLKMSKVFLVTNLEKLSRQCLGFSPTLAMYCNGKFSIVRTSESPRIGRECSLSDILETHPDPKYFLSEKAVNRMNLKRYSPTLSIQATGGGAIEIKNKQPLNTLEELLENGISGSKTEKTIAGTLVKDREFTG